MKKYIDFINERINLINQPNDLVCGPTCLMMLADYYDIKTDIPKLTEVCSTDALTGTTSEKMIKGLNYLSLDYEQFPLKNKENAFNKLKEYKDKKYFILFRTLTRGIKHWILCDYYIEKFHILDPWLGEYYLNVNKLDKVWSPRDYDGFIIKGIK